MLPLQDPLAFTQLLLTVIDEGRRTATYKLAVLLALIDCCASLSDAAGNAPDEIPTRALTRRVVELYWPQVRPYLRTGAEVLRQSSQQTAIILDAVTQLRSLVPGASTFDAAERTVPDAARTSLDRVE